MGDLPEPRFQEGQHVRLRGTDVKVQLLAWWYENRKPTWRVSYDPGRAADEFLQQRGRGRTGDGPIPTDLHTEDELEPIQ
jgi:hypothetical protein